MLREEVSRGLNSRRFFVVLLLCLTLLAGKSYAAYITTHTDDFYLTPYNVSCPGGFHSGGGYSTLTLAENYSAAIVNEVHFDDNGYVLVNGIKIYEDLGACCSAQGHYVDLNITNIVYVGDNSVYGYAYDCCGYCALVKVRFQITYVDSDALTEMDKKWNALNLVNKKAKIKNEYEFNKFSATYATLTATQVTTLIADAKAANPDYSYIDTTLVKGLVSVESSNNFLALSTAGALGLGQFMKDTAGGYGLGTVDAGMAFDSLHESLNLSEYKYRKLGRDDRVWPEKNIATVLKHIHFLNNLSYISNDVDKMLASYNWGQGRLRKLLEKHPDDWFLTRDFPKNVRDYVNNVKTAAGY